MAFIGPLGHLLSTLGLSQTVSHVNEISSLADLLAHAVLFFIGGMMSLNKYKVYQKKPLHFREDVL